MNPKPDTTTAPSSSAASASAARGAGWWLRLLLTALGVAYAVGEVRQHLRHLRRTWKRRG